MVGGVSRLCSFLEHDDDPLDQLQACRVLEGVATAAIAQPYGSDTLSRSNVAKEYAQGMAPDVTKIILSRNSDIKINQQAQLHLTNFLYLIGDLKETKTIAQQTEMIGSLCELLLSSSEKLQDQSCLALTKLLANEHQNIEQMLNSNGIQSLALLLSSTNPTMQEHAAVALGK